MKSINTPSEATKCYHCGEDCSDILLEKDDKLFCCQGCRLVYEVLSENNLCTYYDLESHPGESQKLKSAKSNKFDYLDDKEIITKLLDFKNESESHFTFNIPLIHCASCIWLLENLNQIHNGVISSRVDFIKKKVQIRTAHKKISLKELVNLLSSLGYEPSLNLSDLEGKVKPKVDRKTINRLAVAGFCFGNMMLFSLPEYFSEVDLLDPEFKGVFNYLNVLLSLPIVFYAANDYFISAWNSIKNRKINMDVPIVMGIIALFLYSLWEIFIHSKAGYMDSLGGLLFFLLLGKLYQQKTFATLEFDRDYKSYFPVAVTKFEKGNEVVLPLTKLKVGDVIMVRDEELIPADSILLSDQANIDYSFVTGEGVPVPMKKGDLVYAGGRQKGEQILLTIQKSPSQGYLTDLWNNEAFEKEKEGHLESLSNQVSTVFTWAVIGIALSSLVFWSFSDLSLGVRAFTSVLIVACPCALAMSTPFTLGNTLRIFGRNHFYLKNASVIERLARINSIVFDKTGTLTDTANASITYHGDKLENETLGVLKAMVMYSTHPLSNRINLFLGHVTPKELEEIEEINGLGLLAKYKGQKIVLGSKKFTKALTSPEIGYGNLVFLSLEDHVLGYFHIQSGLRNSAKKVISQLNDKNDLFVLSGDHSHELTMLSKTFGEKTQFSFNQSPNDKLEFLKKLNEVGAHTMMIGDGLNDAGALQESEVGVAVTDKVSHFSPASDAILDAEEFQKIPEFLSFARTSRNVIKVSFGLSILYNILGISLAVQGILSPVVCAILMPLSSISVVIFTTLATNWLAYKKGLITINKDRWK